jgi:hypothetical protein
MPNETMPEGLDPNKPKGDVHITLVADSDAEPLPRSCTKVWYHHDPSTVLGTVMQFMMDHHWSPHSFMKVNSIVNSWSHHLCYYTHTSTILIECNEGKFALHASEAGSHDRLYKVGVIPPNRGKNRKIHTSIHFGNTTTPNMYVYEIEKDCVPLNHIGDWAEVAEWWFRDGLEGITSFFKGRFPMLRPKFPSDMVEEFMDRVEKWYNAPVREHGSAIISERGHHGLMVYLDLSSGPKPVLALYATEDIHGS